MHAALRICMHFHQLVALASGGPGLRRPIEGRGDVVISIVVAAPITAAWRPPCRSHRRKAASRTSVPFAGLSRPLAATLARHGRRASDFGSSVCRGQRLSLFRPNSALRPRVACVSSVPWTSSLRPLLRPQRISRDCALAPTHSSFGRIAARVARPQSQCASRRSMASECQPCSMTCPQRWPPGLRVPSRLWGQSLRRGFPPPCM